MSQATSLALKECGFKRDYVGGWVTVITKPVSRDMSG